VGVARAFTLQGPRSASVVPPAGEVAIGQARAIRVVRRIVEEHQTSSSGIAEVQYVQTGRRLVQAVTVAAGVESEQAAQKNANRRLVRDGEDGLAGVPDDDVPDRGKDARQHRHAGLTTFGREGE